jgi:hypothetical protein
MAVTMHLGGYPAVGRMRWRRDPQPQPTPKGQGLGGRMRTRQRLQLGACLLCSHDGACKRYGHGSNPWFEP